MASAVESEAGMKIDHLPMEDIFSDSNFNIRGDIDHASIVNLARNINQKSLLQPITVQPYNKDGYKYRIVVGHRRYAAFQFLQRETIPAIIKHGLSEVDALALNFIENIERQDLNILQEAHGIEKFVNLGETLPKIVKLTGKGKNWVEIRYNLLGMPKEIQQDAAAGFLTQGQLRDLADVRDPHEQMRLVKAIKEAKIRGETRLPNISRKKSNPTIRKRRNPEEIYSMMDHIIEEIGGNIATRALAWAVGEISDLDLYRELQDFAEEHGKTYHLPPEVERLIVQAKL